MNRIILKTTLFSLLCFVVNIVVSQQLPTVPHSNNKVKIDDKSYYIHIVRKGETLSAISRTYKVPIDSIKKDNLNLESDLKINQYVKVRVVQGEQQTEDNYLYHTVKKGDTPTNIAKRYGIKIDDIYRLNPDSELSIKIGEFLKIPILQQNETQKIIKDELIKSDEQISDTAVNYFIHKVERKETKFGIANKYNISIKSLEEVNGLQNRQLQIGENIKIPIKPTKEYYHKVEPKETIFGISKKYEISKRQFYKLNPSLKNRDLQIGEMVKIPKNEISNKIFAQKQAIINEQLNLEKEQEQQEKNKAKQKEIVWKKCKEGKVDKKKVYKVAFFVPFYLNINDTIGNSNDNKDKKSTPEIYKRSKMFLEFYEGALLALQDLKSQGMSFEVRVFDTQNDSIYVKNILNKNNLSDYDLFVGPFYSSILNIVSDYAWENQINIVSPLSLKKSFIENNPYAFQVSPPFEVQMLYTSEYLNDFDTKNYIIIHDGKNINQEYISAFKKELYASINDSNYMQVKYNEIFYYEAKDSVLRQAFTPNIQNIVVVPSNNQAFVSDLIGKLNGYSFHYDITTFGQPRWMNFDNIELEYLHNINTRIFSNSYIDYSKQNVKQFVITYRKYYKTEPEKYAFQGYDITKYFCSALNMYGKDFRKCIHIHKPKLLQTNFNFVPYSHQGGYQNTGIYILEYSKENRLVKSAEFPK